MSIGIVLKGFNLVNKKMWLELATEVVGGFFILFFLFGWMDVLIIAKWFKAPDINNFSPCYEVYGYTEQGCTKSATGDIWPTVG